MNKTKYQTEIFTEQHRSLGHPQSLSVLISQTSAYIARPHIWG